ncbi:trypsin domain-containing protein [Phthorimaea operculella]|nr:trypsin domain-containing protein [Phthorimaea operculella]
MGGYEIVFRVVNGKPAELGDIPYQVALMTRMIFGPKGFYAATCGGTIVGPKKIVTAAHCVTRKRLFDIGNGRLRESDFRNERIVAGQLRTTTKYGLEGQWRKIKSGKYMAKYNFPRHDIAVLYLMNALNFNFYVQPIAYASKDIDYDRLECLVSGYGMISENKTSQKLLWASLKLLSKKTCEQIHRKTGFRTNDLICTSDDTANVNKGDSGGPLVCRGTGDPAEENSPRGILTGVVSGLAVGVPSGTYFTRVSSYHQFINCAPRFEETTWISLCFISTVLTIR